jgi:hypothetical protein
MVARFSLSELLLSPRNRTRAAWVARISMGLRKSPYVKLGTENDLFPFSGAPEVNDIDKSKVLNNK